jgi:uncharacterized membrane protein
MTVRGCLSLLVMVLALLATHPVQAQQPAPADPATAAADGSLPVWERTLYKTLTYQAVANLSDLALYDVLLGGAAVAGGGFFVANAASAAALYYGYEYAWQMVGPPPGEKTHEDILHKTVLYRVLNSSRNFTLGLTFGGSTTAAIAFVGANFVTDTIIFVGNEYAWDLFRPRAPGQ